MTEQKIYIPIGEDCYSTIYLIKKNLRLFATIFDWIIISPSSILKLFENNFKDYCNNVIFHKNSTRKFKHSDIEIYDKTYDVLLPHAVNDMDKSLDFYREKILIRIQRLENYFKNKNPICFVYKSAKHIPAKLSYDSPYLIFGKEEEFIKIYPRLVKILKERYNYKDDSISYMIV